MNALTTKASNVLLVSTCIVGGVLYAGLKTFVKRRPRKKATWLARLDSQAPRDSRPATREDRLGLSEYKTYRYFIISSVSVGLSMSGAIVYPPLSLVSVPLTVYTSLPLFEQAYISLFQGGRLNVSVFCSTTIIGTLATQHYFLASLIDWLYYYLHLLAQRARYLNQLFLIGLEHGYRQFLAQVYGAKPPSVWVMAHGVGIETPFEDLKVGDIVIVSEGEVIPVEGIIVDGTAVVTSFMRIGVGQPGEKRSGDRVAASTVVLSGRVSIRVEKV